ncbi:hypothetical protein [Mycobacterium sp. SMC-19]|uniref:hypothetical protein n=1 Tax=Mycobacterium sp. SMC-19 TaxID=3381630 RepID=UPI003875B65E
MSTSMVPAASATSRIIVLNGYTEADGWEVTGLDWQTGETVHRTIFGQSNLGNGAYALIEGLPNGDLLFGQRGRTTARNDREVAGRAAQRSGNPVSARAMTSRWISLVPSKMVKIFASRCIRSTG